MTLCFVLVSLVVCENIVDLEVCCEGCPVVGWEVTNHHASINVFLTGRNFTTSFDYVPGDERPILTTEDTVVFMTCSTEDAVVDMFYDDELVKWVVLAANVFCVSPTCFATQTLLSSSDYSLTVHSKNDSPAPTPAGTHVATQTLLSPSRSSDTASWAELLVPIIVIYSVVDALLVVIKIKMPAWLQFMITAM